MLIIGLILALYKRENIYMVNINASQCAIKGDK